METKSSVSTLQSESTVPAKGQMIGALGASPTNEERIRTFVASNLLETNNEKAYEVVMDQVEKELLIQALTMFKGNQVQTANYLGITRNTLRAKISKYGI